MIKIRRRCKRMPWYNKYKEAQKVNERKAFARKQFIYAFKLFDTLARGGHSITKHTGGLARRSESKTPKYLSKKKTNIRKYTEIKPPKISLK